jgi:hypothetical protein
MQPHSADLKCEQSLDSLPSSQDPLSPISISASLNELSTSSSSTEWDTSSPGSDHVNIPIPISSNPPLPFPDSSESSSPLYPFDFDERLQRKMRSAKSGRNPAFITFSKLQQDLYYQSSDGHMPLAPLHRELYDSRNPCHFRFRVGEVPQINSTKYGAVFPTSRNKRILEEWVKGIALFFGNCDAGCTKKKKFYRDNRSDSGSKGDLKGLDKDPFIRPSEIIGHITICDRKEWMKSDLKKLFRLMARE